MSQAAFTAALLDAAQPAPEGLVGPTGAAAGKRYDVYRNNVAVGLAEALEVAFPAIRKLVGPEFFRAMAGVYLRRHPPHTPLMMHYGREMPEFLAGFPPVSHLPYLPDVARIELAVRAAYHAADDSPLTPEALAVEPERLATMTFAPTAAVRTVGSRYPAASIWRAQMAGGAPGMGPELALISRPGFDVEVDVLTGGAADVTLALLSGRPLAEAAGRGDIGPVLTLLLQRNALKEPNP